MLTPLEQLLAAMADGPVCLVTVQETRGSTPREQGAWMAIALAAPDVLIGSIGGGHLEWQAMREAYERLLACATTGGVPHEPVLRKALGPSLGQCCGGVVFLRFECFGPQDVAMVRKRLAPSLHRLALFGGGHVGRALVRVLAPLPFAIHWIDSRDEIFPEGLSSKVECEHSDPVQAAVPGIAPGSMVLIMSFSHAEDQDIVAACLTRQRKQADLPFIGLIGSKTKWATFRHRLEARGYTEEDFARIICPIGVPGIVGKDPEVIAVAVAAQLLIRVSPIE